MVYNDDNNDPAGAKLAKKAAEDAFRNNFYYFFIRVPQGSGLHRRPYYTVTQFAQGAGFLRGLVIIGD